MTLDEILASGEMLEIVVEIDSVLVADGSTKTWYYSTHPGREDILPAGTLCPPYIDVARFPQLSDVYAGDFLFSAGTGALSSNNSASLVITQPLPEVDQLSQVYDYTFTGYPIRFKIGLLTDAHADLILFKTARQAGEPAMEFSSAGISASFKVSGILESFSSELLTRKYNVGIPHCVRFSTATGRCSIPRVAAYHDLERFTGMIRFRCSANPSASIFLHTKVNTSTDNNWQLILSTSGTVQLFGSGGGVADMQIVSGNMCDGEWKSVVFARDAANTSYLMINGSIIGTDSNLSGTPNLSAVNISIGFRASGTQAIDFCDGRLYDKYIPPQEARSLAKTRASAGDVNLVGYWPFTDNAGGAVADEGTGNSDGALNGTVNVDYSWQASDLGEPGTAGIPYPICEGEVSNARPQLIDGVRDKYRFDDGSTFGLSSFALTVGSQGTVLTGGGVNYTAPPGAPHSIISMVTSEDEPITFTHRYSGTTEQNFYLSTVVATLLAERTPITNIDVDQAAALHILCPWLAGFYSTQDVTVTQMLTETLYNSGLCSREGRAGDFIMDYLLPPFGYGPYGEPCMDLRGKAGNSITFGDVADISGSMTLALWFNSAQLDQTTTSLGGSAPLLGTFHLISKGNGLTNTFNYDLHFESSGTNAGKFGFRTGGATVFSPAGLIEPSTWYYVAVVFDDTANTVKFYVAKYGTTLSLVSTATNTNSPAVNNDSLQIGSFSVNYSWGAVQHVNIWNVTKTLSQLQTLMSTPPTGNESNLSAYIPFNEGAGNPLNVVAGTTGTINGTPQWAPKLTIDLRDTPSVKFSELHRLIPASKIVVRFDRNYYPMPPGEIDFSLVSSGAGIDLEREWRQIDHFDADVHAKYKRSRTVVLDTALSDDRESARRLTRSLAYRLGADRWLVTLACPPNLNISRRACGLNLGDEVGLVGSMPSPLATARSWRVVAVHPNLAGLSTVLVLWR